MVKYKDFIKNTGYEGIVTSILIGVMFLTGRGLVFGIEGMEPTSIPIPQSDVAGWAFIILAFVLLIPAPWIKLTVRFLRKKRTDKLSQFRGTDK